MTRDMQRSVGFDTLKFTLSGLKFYRPMTFEALQNTFQSPPDEISVKK